MFNKVSDLCKNTFNNTRNYLVASKDHFVTGAFCVGSSLLLTSLASYSGCNVSNEWYTLGAAGAVGSFAGARYVRNTQSVQEQAKEVESTEN